MRTGVGRKTLLVCTAMLGAFAVSLSWLPASAPFCPAAHADPTGIKFKGAGSCGGGTCHGRDINPNKKADDKDFSHDEKSIWEKQDRHSEEYQKTIKKGLTSKESLKIAAKLKIPDVTKSKRCLDCHGLSGFSNGETKSRITLNYDVDMEDGELQKSNFKPTDGVSCDGCHGPSAKYDPPHRNPPPGWTQAERVKGSDNLYNNWGLYDTKNLKFRANQCVSCHLKIAPDMIAAGHPELPFELDSMSHGKWMHWRPSGDYFGVKAWAMGQFVCMREAALQLAERVTGKADAELIGNSYKQLAAHATMSRHASKFLAPNLEKEIEKHVAAVHANWADAAKVDAELHALGKAADALADELNKQVMAGTVKGKEFCDAMLKDVAAEGEMAAAAGYPSARQYAYAMVSLVEADFLKGAAPDPNAKVMKAKTKDDEKSHAADDLDGNLGDASEYEKDKFLQLAKKMMALVPGGSAIPMPGNAPPFK